MWLFLIGNGAEIRPLEMGRKSPVATIKAYPWHQKEGIHNNISTSKVKIQVSYHGTLLQRNNKKMTISCIDPDKQILSVKLLLFSHPSI